MGSMNQTEKALSLAGKIGGKNELNCIAELDPTASDQAKAMDENDRRNLPLHGVPVLIKDMVEEFILDEQDHFNWVKGHLCLIDQIGMENYLIEMLGE